jgi:hypothetical protein
MMPKSVVVTSTHCLLGGIATFRLYGIAAFMSWWLTIYTWLMGYQG